VKHRLATHAAAIAFRILVSLVPLALLGLALLGAFGLDDVWTETVAPSLEERVTAPVFRGIDHSAKEILSSGGVALIAFAGLLLLWEISRGVRAAMVALNEIHDVEEKRSVWRLLGTTLALAFAIGACLVAAFLVVVTLPRLTDGLARVALTIAAWSAGVLLLGFVVGLLVRYGPTEHPSPKWASAGSALVVAVWLGASLLFGWWAGSVASYRSAVGSLTVFLLLTAYAFTCAAIFLIGSEIDERARQASAKRRD
jgi:membrane protein